MNAIEAKGLRKEYGALAAVRDIDLEIRGGEVMGLIGPNGAGKTTLLKMLATLLRPTRGEAKVLGMDTEKEYLEIRKRIGYLPDFFNLYHDLTLEECLRFFARSYGVSPRLIGEKVDMALRYVEMEDKRKDLIRNLSRGMVQRIGLGALLVREPEIYLLDEPASGLDPKARIQLREILKTLSGQGKTILISSHILTELSGFCTHIAILHKGQIVRQGKVEEIRDTLAGGKTVRITVLDRAQEAGELIRNGNLSATVTDICDSCVTVRMTGGREDLAAVNRMLVEHGIGVCSLAEERMDLEDLFMKISTESDSEVRK